MAQSSRKVMWPSCKGRWLVMVWSLICMTGPRWSGTSPCILGQRACDIMYQHCHTSNMSMCAWNTTDETGWRQKEKQPHLWSYRIYHHSEEQHLLHPPKQTLHHCTRYTHKGHSKLDKDNRKKVLHTGVCVQKLNKNIVIFHRDNLAQRKDGLCGSLWDWKHLYL